jgi:hypothetical protein
MMAPKLSAEYWRGRAEEARTLAEEMHSPETRRQMLEIAAGYDRLAQWAERNGTAQPVSPHSTCGRRHKIGSIRPVIGKSPP